MEGVTLPPRYSSGLSDEAINARKGGVNLLVYSTPARKDAEGEILSDNGDQTHRSLNKEGG